MVVNPSFELDGAPVGAPTGWQTQTGTGTNDNADYTETYGGAHSGTYHATHYRPTSYEVYTYQTISGLTNGTYRLRAWVKNSGSQAQVRARNYGGPALSLPLASANQQWIQVEISSIAVSNGQCEIGFYSNAQSDQWFFFDDVELTRQAATTNTLLNASYDDDQAAVWAPRQWATQTYGTTPYFASYSETYGGAHTGTYHGTHYRPENYEVYTYQTAPNLANGTYTLSAWVRSTGWQAQVQLQAKNYGGALVATTIPASPTQWVQVSIPGIVVSNGTCEVGFYSRASGGQWLHFDDVELVRQNTAARTALAAKTSATAVSAPMLYPNPANDQVVVTATFAQATVADLVLVDTQGIPVATYRRQASGGDNQFTIQTSNLPTGLYMLQIKGSQTLVTQRLEIRH